VVVTGKIRSTAGCPRKVLSVLGWLECWIFFYRQDALPGVQPPAANQ